MGHSSWRKVINNVLVNGTGTIYSAAIPIGYSKNFGLVIVIETADTSKVRTEYQVIPTRESDVELVGKVPNEVNLAWVTPEVGAVIIVASASMTGSKAKGFAPIVSSFIRIKVIGESGNGTGTKVSIYVSMYDEV